MRRLATLCGLLLISACTGRIESRGPFTGAGGGSGAGGGAAASCDDPGHVTMRRLNRAEYDNTLRDLLGDTTQPANNFPADPSGAFDNNGDVLAMSPLLLELYESTASTVVDAALLPPLAPSSHQYPAQTIAHAMCPEPPGADYTCYGYLDATAGTPATPTVDIWNFQYYLDKLESFPSDGDYLLTVRVYQATAGFPAQLNLLVDGKVAYQGTVTAPRATPVLVTATITVSAGNHRLQIVNANAARAYMRDLGVDFLQVDGPNNPPNPARDAFRAKFFSCDPTVMGEDPCATQILRDFAHRAYRRPVTTADLTPLLDLVHLAKAQGDDFQTGVRLALKRALTSSEFLFKAELDAPPDSATPHPLTDLELATRLSYFLWASTPDDELLAAAEAGRLQDPATLEAQARRMLADPKADALVEVFAAQWLRLRALAPASPSLTTFPTFDGQLKQAMLDETSLYFRSFLREDHSALELLDAKYTFLNERLATHYGIAGITGPAMQRVALTGAQRGGLLTQGSILTLTSPPNRTSPVKRGKWVLDQLLCQPPPPPPANVPPLPSGVDAAGKTLRQLAEAHRNNPVCASCHVQMDPIGFSLEHYDGIGHWRDTDGTQAIDATGKLPDGRTFDGEGQLSAVLKADARFPRCLSREVLTYAIGRDLNNTTDACTLDSLTAAMQLTNYRLPELAIQVVKTDQFRQRRGVKVTP